MMFTHSFVFVLIFTTTIFDRNLAESRSIRDRWHNIVYKLTNKFNIDNRQLIADDILLFPDIAYQPTDNNKTNTIWRVIIHGWKYRDNPRRDWLGFSTSLWLERLAKNVVNKNDVLYLNGSINRERLRPFFVSDQINRTITIEIANQKQILHTDIYGQFYEEIEVSDEIIQQYRLGDIITYNATYNDGNSSQGIAYLIDPSHGLSVISDIDDTIKVSEVLDKVRLLANTFIYPFKAVPGMANVFQQWKSKNANITFHYLSGMPNQLYTLTQEFINENHFPQGSFHMRHFGWALTSLFDFLHSRSTFLHKTSYLHFFLGQTQRDFILIGDSGEKDPEIYGKIARIYPERIRAIFIRAIKNESANDQRFHDAFQGIDRSKWSIFNNSNQIPVKRF